MAATPLIEPTVLAAAKEFLTRDVEQGYAVVDAQFGRQTWGCERIPKTIRRQLEPINSLSMGNGYPDALIAPPRSDTYHVSGDGETDQIPLAVVEAKGETDSTNRKGGQVAITQAHSHLDETNVAYAALPRSNITNRERSLARELNIGLIAVRKDGVNLLERPRLVGGKSSSTTDTIRFHARLGSSAIESLKKNHPKNAIGYSLAVAADQDTNQLFQQYVIKSVNDARLDATALGLVKSHLGQSRLTDPGREAVRTIQYDHDGIIPALEAIQGQTGSSARFINELPVMGTVARQTLLTYPPTQVLVNTLEELAELGCREPSLAQVAKAVAKERPDFALDLFANTSAQDEMFEKESENDERRIDLSAFDDGEIYSTHTTFQYKAVLYHVGLITERGVDKKSEIEPTEEIWALENTF